MKCKVFKLFQTEYQRKQEARRLLMQEALANDPNPSQEEVTKRAEDLPPNEFLYEGTILKFITAGASDEFGAFAVVEKPDGFLEEVLISNIQIIEEHQDA